MTGFIGRAVYAITLPLIGGWMSWALVSNVGFDHLAKWLPATIFIYLLPANLTLRLIFKFHDLARSPDLISRELKALKPAVDGRIRTLWVFEIVLVACAALAGSAPLALHVPTGVGIGWVYTACVAFFAAVFVTTYIPSVFRELRDFEWQAAERAKRKLERDGYVEKMRQAASVGFIADDNIDGSKRVVHGN